MPRNLDRRVEVLFPVEDPAIKSALIDIILERQLHDTEKIRWMNNKGTYTRKSGDKDSEPSDAQNWFVGHRGAWYRGSP
jgi:polyphosphate kinase